MILQVSMLISYIFVISVYFCLYSLFVKAKAFAIFRIFLAYCIPQAKHVNQDCSIYEAVLLVITRVINLVYHTCCWDNFYIKWFWCICCYNYQTATTWVLIITTTSGVWLSTGMISLRWLLLAHGFVVVNNPTEGHSLLLLFNCFRFINKSWAVVCNCSVVCL